jgi:hypothetical protein
MDIIKYNDFNKLRLENFVSSKQDILSFKDFEFMNGTWSGQSLGFTEWLHLDGNENTTSISLDLTNLPDTSINKILSTLKLNVTKGMSEESIITTFGQPHKTENFISDRVTFEYVIGSTEKYYLSLTIHHYNGLIYVVLMNYEDAIETLEATSSNDNG